MKRRLVLAGIVTLPAMPARAQALRWGDDRSEGKLHFELAGTPTLNTLAIPMGNKESKLTLGRFALNTA